MKYLVPVLLLIIIVLVAALSFTAGKSGLSIKNSQTPSPTQALKQSPSQTPTSTQANSKKVTGGGILSFPKYEITVPSDWQEKQESQGVDNEKVTLTKGSYKISILQGGFGGAVCLFPGDPDTEGPSARYDSFKEITSKDGDLFRRSWTGDELSASGYGICHETQYGWGAPSLYGSISYTTPLTKTRAMFDEMDSILASITKI